MSIETFFLSWFKRRPPPGNPHPAIHLVAATLPVGTVGVDLGTYQLRYTGGTAPVLFSTTGATGGLQLSGTGLLSGVPSTAGTFTFLVTVLDANSRTDTLNYSVRIENELTIVTTPTVNGIAGQPWNYQYTTAGGRNPYFVETSVRPAGYSFNTSSGTLTIGAAVAGLFTHSVIARDADGRQTGSVTITWNINAIVNITTTSPLPDGRAGDDYSYFMQATGAPVIFWVLTSIVPTSTAFVLSGVGELTNTQTFAGTWDLTIAAVDSSAALYDTRILRVTIQPALQIEIVTLDLGFWTTDTAVTVPVYIDLNVPYTVSLVSGQMPPGTSPSAQGVTGTPSTPGNYTFTLRADAGATYGTDDQQYTVNVTIPVVMTPKTLPAATVSVNYNNFVTATGGAAPLTYSLTGGAVPSGMNPMSSAGVFSGVPISTGTFQMQIRATDSQGRVSPSVTYTIPVQSAVFFLTTSPLPAATANVAYSRPLLAQGGDGNHVFTKVGSEPLWVTVEANGLVHGGPTIPATDILTVMVSSAGSTDQRDFTLVTNPAPTQAVEITTLSLPPVTANTDYAPPQLTAIGGGGTYTWIKAQVAPSWVTISPTGFITGHAPVTTGSVNLFVRCTDAADNTNVDTNLFTFNITAAPVVLITAPPGIPSLITGTSLPSISLVAAGGTGPYTYQRVSLTAPGGGAVTWISVNPTTGELTGNAPALVGNYVLIVTATDSLSVVSQQYTYDVLVTPTDVSVSANPAPINGTVGSIYSHTFSATGGVGPYDTWTLVTNASVLNGINLTLNATTGQLSGTPNGTFSGQFGVTCEDTLNTASAERLFNLTIASAVQPVQITTHINTLGPSPDYTPDPANGIPDMVVSTPVASYGITLTATGGSGVYRWTRQSDSRTSWLGVNQTTGALIGIAAGGLTTANVVIPISSPGFGVTCADENNLSNFDTEYWRFSIRAAATLTITNNNPLTGATYPGTYSGVTMTGSGGTPSNYAWSIFSQTDPSGATSTWITINPTTGALGGTIPSVAGNYTLTVHLTDGVLTAPNRAYTITVTSSAVSISTPVGTSLPNGVTTTTYTQGLTATSGTPPYSNWRIASAPEGKVRFFCRHDPWMDKYDGTLGSPNATNFAFYNSHFAGMFVYGAGTYWATPFDDLYTTGGGAILYKDSHGIKTDHVDYATQSAYRLVDNADGTTLLRLNWGTFDQYVGDIGNQQFRANWITALQNSFASTTLSGVWVDDVNMRLNFVRDDNHAAATPRDNSRGGIAYTEANWRADMATFMEEIRAAFPDKVINHNALWWLSGAASDTNIRRQVLACDYFTMEYAINDTNHDTAAEYDAYCAWIDYVHSLGRSILHLDYDTNATRRDYALATYLLTSNGKDMYCSDVEAFAAPSTAFGSSWHTGFDRNLGFALGARTTVGATRQRIFEGGTLIVTPWLGGALTAPTIPTPGAIRTPANSGMLPTGLAIRTLGSGAGEIYSAVPISPCTNLALEIGVTDAASGTAYRTYTLTIAPPVTSADDWARRSGSGMPWQVTMRTRFDTEYEVKGYAFLDNEYNLDNDRILWIDSTKPEAPLRIPGYTGMMQMRIDYAPNVQSGPNDLAVNWVRKLDDTWPRTGLLADSGYYPSSFPGDDSHNEFWVYFRLKIPAFLADSLWEDCDNYSSVVVAPNGNHYRCKIAHTSSAATQPGVGASWTTYWIQTHANQVGETTWASGVSYRVGIPSDGWKVTYINRYRRAHTAGQLIVLNAEYRDILAGFYEPGFVNWHDTFGIFVTPYLSTDRRYQPAVDHITNGTPHPAGLNPSTPVVGEPTDGAVARKRYGGLRSYSQAAYNPAIVAQQNQYGANHGLPRGSDQLSGAQMIRRDHKDKWVGHLHHVKMPGPNWSSPMIWEVWEHMEGRDYLKVFESNNILGNLDSDLTGYMNPGPINQEYGTAPTTTQGSALPGGAHPYNGVWLTPFNTSRKTDSNDQGPGHAYIYYGEVICAKGPIGIPAPGILNPPVSRYSTIPSFISATPGRVTKLTTVTNGAPTMWDGFNAEWKAVDTNRRTVVAYSGATYDFDKRLIYQTGGGHNDSRNNSIMSFNFNSTATLALGWQTVDTSTSAAANAAYAASSNRDYADAANNAPSNTPRPTAIHSYNGLCMTPTHFWRVGGSPSRDIGQLCPWLVSCDLVTHQYLYYAVPSVAIDYSVIIFHAPDYNKLVTIFPRNSHAYVYDLTNYPANMGSVGTISNFLQTAGAGAGTVCSAYDQVNHRLLYWDNVNGPRVAYFNGSTFPINGAATLGAGSNMSGVAPAIAASLVWDPERSTPGNSCFWAMILSGGNSSFATNVWKIQETGGTASTPGTFTFTPTPFTGDAISNGGTGTTYNNNPIIGAGMLSCLKGWDALAFFTRVNDAVYTIKKPT